MPRYWATIEVPVVITANDAKEADALVRILAEGMSNQQPNEVVATGEIRCWSPVSMDLRDRQAIRARIRACANPWHKAGGLYKALSLCPECPPA